MNVWFAALAAISGYLVGSVSFARLISRILKPDLDLSAVSLPVDGVDGPVRLSGMGATTAAVALGPRVGCLIGLLDIFKAALPALIFKILFPGQYYFLIAAAAAVAGHIWPVFYRFRGGWGMSPIYGGFLVADWVGVPVAAVLGLFFGFAVVRDMFVAYISGTWLMIPWLWFRTHDWAYVAYAVVVNLLFVLGLLPEIRLYLKNRSAGNVDMRAGMQATPMGRGMQHMARMLRLDKDR